LIRKLTVTSELDNLAEIAHFIRQTATDMGMDADSAYALQLAVDEACTNVIDYAYQRRGGQPVAIECREEHGNCIVVIRDHGRPFDPRCVPAPKVSGPISKRKTGGLGIYLMSRLMDEVRFHFEGANGNELTLVKTIKPGVVQAKAADAGLC
jgi:anti-sigma regulatory factor (Ser/Thr protein kinase)